MTDRKAVVVGISGASSSGKTTLARLLRDIFPNTFILHEDDFYKAESEYVFPVCFLFPHIFISSIYRPDSPSLVERQRDREKEEDAGRGRYILY